MNSSLGGQGHRNLVAIPVDWQCANGFDEVLRDTSGRQRAPAVQEDCELFAADTSKCKGFMNKRAELFAQTTRHRLKDSVPRRVPIGIVQRLKFIDIEHDSRDCPTLVSVTKNCFCGLVKLPTIWGPYQRICSGQNFQISVGLDKKVGLAHERKCKKWGQSKRQAEREETQTVCCYRFNGKHA